MDGKPYAVHFVITEGGKTVESDSSDGADNCSPIPCSYVAHLRPLLRYRV